MIVAGSPSSAKRTSVFDRPSLKKKAKADDPNEIKIWLYRNDAIADSQTKCYAKFGDNQEAERACKAFNDVHRYNESTSSIIL